MAEEKKVEAKKEDVSIQEIRAKNEKACLEELQVVLDKHKCVILGVPFISEQGTIAARPMVKSKE